MMYHRHSCGIEDEEEDSLIVTGGGWYGTVTTDKVTKYFKDGSYQEMPLLNTARYLHACSSYKNTNQEKVSIYLIVENVLFITVTHLRCT